MSLADEECQPSIPASLLYPTSAHGGDKNLIFSINNVDGRRTIEERRYSTSNASIGDPLGSRLEIIQAGKSLLQDITPSAHKITKTGVCPQHYRPLHSIARGRNAD